jgi:polyisoprenyl-phosphate glycosyltransferase
MVVGKSLLILIPSYNDWDAVRLLIPRIDSAIASSAWTASLLVVDDASSEPLPNDWPGVDLLALKSVDLLHLRCNLGHQRAIALGLYHAYEFTNADAVLIMDGDGEDRAEDIPVLLDEFERSGGSQTVFAARTRRMESWAFQFSYRAYKLIHLMLTGVEVRVGNFSVVPRTAVTRLMAVSDLWNHYAAAVFRSRLPRHLVPLERGARLVGHSQMNFGSLLLHGLSAISVFADRVSARLLASAFVLAIAGLSLMFIWGVNAVSVTMIALAVQALSFGVLFALTIVSRRSAPNFLLLRDAPHFILGTTNCGRQRSRPDLAILGTALEEKDQAEPLGAAR